MRKISSKIITDIVKKLFLDINYRLPDDVLKKLQIALKKETNTKAKNILKQILENAKVAKNEKIPICQDTGTAIIFIEVGQDVNVTGGNLTHAINKGVRQAYKEGYLRKSIVSCPLERKNTQDNTPASIHIEIVPGNKLKIFVISKGGGAENMSQIKMFPPSTLKKEIIDFVVDTIKKAGANACPPLIIGIGIGGTFDTVGTLAKKALLRNLNSHNKNRIYRNLENEILNEINKTGIGPMALGGKTTALAVLIDALPTHITSLPVAVNIQCHAHRRKTAII
ncbi:MAG: fumarate hydratase [Elusimicrobia bacterium RIFOXYC2_FULL_34_12]|nr:MAG: fumarate hydratase [Elusimicrobia bacterium RIFOXYC2_FULL_34_12]OGS38149.1 MAG: fumarate hydratase [Elusimicrobia bacterium RIFOXYD2_FULL_34_30]